MNQPDSMRKIILDQVERLLADHAGGLAAIEAGGWPAALWDALERLGLPLLLVPEELGGIGLGWADAVAVWRVVGQHGAPAPVGECMLVNGLLAAAGIEPPAGFTSFGPVVPFGRFAAHVLAEDGTLYVPNGMMWGSNLAREPRDGVARGKVLGTGASNRRGLRLGTALLRAAQMAGAAQHALDLAVDWANTRKQFGRALGKFQAIQQQLALVASEVALMGVAAAAAGRAVDARGLEGAAFEIGSAKIIAGEGAQTTAATVHQVFAAIGITEDHALHHTTRRLWAWRDEGGSERFWAAEIGGAALARGGAALWPDITGRDIP